jgi:hypothetical protein
MAMISKKVKKKLPFFYKISLFLFLIFFITLFYFIVLVSAQPRSVPMITNKIQQYLDKNFAGKIKIKETSVGFTRYGTVKISISSLKILQDVQKSSFFSSIVDKKKFLLIPKAEAEISLLDLVMLKLQITKLKIIAPQIDLKKQDGNSVNQDAVSSIVKLFTSKNQSIKMLEIVDGSIKFDDQIDRINNVNTSIVINPKKNYLLLSSKSLLNIKKATNFNIDSNCLLFMNNQIKCEIKFYNFNSNNLFLLFPKQKIIKNINGIFYGNIRINSIHNFNLNINSDRGNFDASDFFKEQIEFANLNILAEVDLLQKNIIISKMQSELISKIKNNNSKISASANIGKQINIDLAIGNVAINELFRFWPLTLNQNDIRSWVLKSFSDGVVDGKANISLNNNGELQDILAWLDFSQTNLNYHHNFPIIKNIDGKASFSKNDMLINLNKANTLDSNINKAEIVIKDFDQSILEIDANLTGDASDLLRPINNSQQFATEVKKYLNGNAETNLKLKIPLIVNEISLANVNIDVSCLAKDIKNKFLSGESVIKVSKKENSEKFAVNADLTKSKFILNNLDIEKNIGQQSFLDFDILINKNNYNLQNIKLQTKSPNKTLIGSVSFVSSPFFIKEINIKNQDFAKQNYSFGYSQKSQAQPKNIFLKGKYFDIETFLSTNSDFFKNNNDPNDRIIAYINLKKLGLFNKKMLHNFTASLDCSGLKCAYIGLKAETPQKKDITITNGEQIRIKINDLVYLLDSFNIPTLLADGAVAINLIQRSSSGLDIAGKLINTEKITIFDNEAVKKLAKDKLTSQIKETIFTSNKTTFDTVKIDFEIRKTKIIINSFIANNFKIGITAKGEVDLVNGDINIKGMIIPGYIVNSLFGIGKIPILSSALKGLFGSEGGGIFGVSYRYVKNTANPNGSLITNKISAFVPSGIQNLFD